MKKFEIRKPEMKFVKNKYGEKNLVLEETTEFNNGIYLDGKKITEKELWSYVSFLAEENPKNNAQEQREKTNASLTQEVELVDFSGNNNDLYDN